MRKWEPEEVKKITYGLLGGIAVGLIAGILLKTSDYFSLSEELPACVSLLI